METTDRIDYFDYPYCDEVPYFINDIITMFQNVINECEMDTYEACATLVEKLEQFGWTYEYGLDGEPYGLRPLDEIEQVESLELPKMQTAIL
jgi:hypothetical protein